MKPIADKLGVSQAQLAYAWVLRNKRVSSAITGARRPEQVYEAGGALDKAKFLTDDVMEEIEEVLDNKLQVGPRRFA